MGKILHRFCGLMLSAVYNGVSSRIRERRRWSKASSRENGARVFYGIPTLPQSSELASGGIIKCMDLSKKWPNQARSPNLLYLVSSALPPYFPLMIQEVQKRGGKCILNQNGVAYPAWCPTNWEEQNRCLSKAYATADHIVFQSNFCKAGADKYLGPRTTSSDVLHNPVDCSQFYPSPEPLSPQHRSRLLLAGSHHFSYRVECALHTVAHLQSSCPEIHLTVAGRMAWNPDPASCMAEMKGLSEKLGIAQHVSFTGPYSQKQALSLFHSTGILLHAQYADACPRLLAEALACGLPVVYSATGGAPELVDSQAGIGIPGPCDWEQIHTPDPQLLAKAVLQVLDQYDSFSEAARKHALQHLDLPHWMDRHETIFNNLLNQKPN